MTASEGVEIVCFPVDCVRCAIEATQVSGSHRASTGSPVPSVESCLGLTGVKIASARQILTLRQGGELSVNSTVELRHLNPGDIHPLPPLLSARCAVRGLKALAIDAQGLILLVDCQP